MSRPRLVVALIALALAPRAHAAEISLAKNMDLSATIKVVGEILPGDDERFAAVASGAPDDTTVMLAGPGGNLVSGLRIGSAIRMRAWKTYVSDGSFCASSCGLIWLGGVQRTVGWQARIGFHAAWAEGPDGVKREVGSGNALVGSYLSKLGLTDNAIFYLTFASPDAVAWLTATAAKEVGIRAVFATRGTEPPSQVTLAPRSGSTASPPAIPPDATATALLKLLYADFPRSVRIPGGETCTGRTCKVRLVAKDSWTDKTGNEHVVVVAVAEVEGDCHACAAILGIGQFQRLSPTAAWQKEILTPAVARIGDYGVFGGKASFMDGGVLGRVVLLTDGGGGQGAFGDSLSLILSAKGIFKELLVLSVSLSVDATCDAREAECQKTIARANYVSKYSILFDGDGNLHLNQSFTAAIPIPTASWVIDLNTTVHQTAGGKADLGIYAEDRAVLWPIEFVNGHADRVNFEAWFSGLTDDMRLGAESWASRRSLKVPGNCGSPTGHSPQWSEGCGAARERLTGFDARRNAIPDYKRGWNSPK